MLSKSELEELSTLEQENNPRINIIENNDFSKKEVLLE